MKCSRCGKNNVEGVACCVWCGAAFTRGKGESGSSLLSGRIIVLVLGAAVLWLVVSWFFDAPPIENDYTVADLRSAAEEYNESYEVLTGLAEDEDREDAPLIGLTAEDVNAIDAISEAVRSRDQAAISEAIHANAAAIRQAWENGKKGRDVIARLAEFPEIADLSEPKAITDMEAGKVQLCYANLKYLAFLLRAYAMLEVEPGNDQVVAEELVRFDSVVRKFNINARSLLTRMVCTGILAHNMNVAGYIANKPQASEAIVAFLAEHFRPFTDADASMRNALIFEYLTAEKTLRSLSRKGVWAIPGLSKRNSTQRLCRNSCDKWIAMSDGTEFDSTKQLSVWPVVGPRWIDVELDENYKLPLAYMCYNPVGGFLIRIFAPAMERVCDIQTQLRIRDDILQIVLNKRLGRDVSLKARAYGDEYIINIEGKQILSPGPDGQTGTKDDITMPIDPNVIRW